jgi:hypothetical protein
MWANVWAATSAFASVLTLIVALWALLRWRKQDELRVKLDFKKAVGDYAFHLTQMPANMGNPFVRNQQTDNAQELISLLGVCNFAWYMTEGMLDSNHQLVAHWNFIYENTQSYLSGEIPSSELGPHCMGVMNTKFVFK